MSTKFMMFTDAVSKASILVKPDHVRIASESGENSVRLVMDRWEGISGGYNLEVEGDLKSVWATLEGRQPSVVGELSSSAKAAFEERMSKFGEAIRR
jgi:hypothetical protein